MTKIPIGLCQCGCGSKTSIAKMTLTARGQKKGQPLKFISGHNAYVRYANVQERFEKGFDAGKPDECWEWKLSKAKSGGYGNFGGHHASITSYKLYRGLIPEGMEVCHSCDNPPCVNPNHLFLGTHVENVKDMWSKGRGGHGELHGTDSPRARFNREQIIEMRKLFSDGVAIKGIRIRFDADKTTIRRIVRRISYRNIP